MKKSMKNLTGTVLSAFLSLALLISMSPLRAHAYEYTYQATVYAGNIGALTSGVEITVNNRKSGSTWNIDRTSDKIVISGLAMGDVVSIDVLTDGAVQLAPNSPYYVLGVRDSGLDNAEAGRAAFTVDRDRDFVVAYGMKAQETTYTVYYQALDGTTLAPPRTYTGNVGDKPVAAYLYVEGYEPLSYNVTKTLSADPASNAMTFLYKPLESPEIRVTIPGDTHYVHVPGGSYTVNVPGQTIYQTVPSSSNNTGNGGGNGGGGVNDTGAVSNPNGPATGNNGTGNTGTGDNGQTGTGDANTPGAGDNGQSGTDGNGQAGVGDNGATGTDGNGATGTDGNGEIGTDGQTGEGNNGQTGDGGNGQAGDGGNGQTGGDGTMPGTSLNGTGTHGQRPDATQSGGGSEDGTGDGSGSGGSYKPGGSLDVVISSNYTPADIVDLDENPSGVPMGENPNEDGSYNAGADNTQDPAQDGMNENTDNTGTGQMAPEGETGGGFPLVPVICGVVAVIVIGAGVVIFVTYRKQHAEDAEDDGDA